MRCVRFRRVRAIRICTERNFNLLDTLSGRGRNILLSPLVPLRRSVAGSPNDDCQLNYHAGRQLKFIHLLKPLMKFPQLVKAKVAVESMRWRVRCISSRADRRMMPILCCPDEPTGGALD